jgi:hypothetical protein
MGASLVRLQQPLAWVMPCIGMNPESFVMLATAGRSVKLILGRLSYQDSNVRSCQSRSVRFPSEGG